MHTENMTDAKGVRSSYRNLVQSCFPCVENKWVLERGGRMPRASPGCTSNCGRCTRCVRFFFNCWASKLAHISVTHMQLWMFSSFFPIFLLKTHKDRFAFHLARPTINTPSPSCLRPMPALSFTC